MLSIDFVKQGFVTGNFSVPNCFSPENTLKMLQIYNKYIHKLFINIFLNPDFSSKIVEFYRSTGDHTMNH